MVLWLLLTSDCSIIHHWIGYQVYLTYQSDLPRYKRNLSLHLSAPSILYDLRQKGFCFVSQTHPVVPSLIWSLCSSDRRFAARFLQISRHREHPCVKLTVTSVFTARDLHPIDYAHAGRTTKTDFPLGKSVYFLRFNIFLLNGKFNTYKRFLALPSNVPQIPQSSFYVCISAESKHITLTLPL